MIEVLERLGHSAVNDEAYITLIDPHAKGKSRYDHLQRKHKRRSERKRDEEERNETNTERRDEAPKKERKTCKEERKRRGEEERKNRYTRGCLSGLYRVRTRYDGTPKARAKNVFQLQASLSLKKKH